MKDKPILPTTHCTGCAACYNICSSNAINMSEDSLGFKYPEIDSFSCIGCLECEEVCPIFNPSVTFPTVKVFAAYAKNPEIYHKSTSGGIATLLSQKIIERGGVVYGCAQLNYKNIKHLRVDKLSDLSYLQATKYVQGDINYIYRQVKTDLERGKIVLFIGLSCQIAGLKSFLPTEYSNLFTVDLICGGVRSMKLLEEQIESISQVSNKEVNNAILSFRWNEKVNSGYKAIYGYWLKINRKGNLKTIFKKEFSQLPFNKSRHYVYRDCCYKCNFIKPDRIGDITLGDFWGLGSRINTNLNITDGVSLVMINSRSSKGQQLFDLIKEDIYWEKHTLEEALPSNKRLYTPFPIEPDRDMFLEECKKSGFIKASRKFFPFSFKEKHPILYHLYWFMRVQLSRIKGFIK